MMKCNSTLSLSELISSDILSTKILSLDNEESDPLESTWNPILRRDINASKVSLLTVKSFLEFRNSLIGNGEDENGLNSGQDSILESDLKHIELLDLSFLRADDFFVELESLSIGQEPKFESHEVALRLKVPSRAITKATSNPTSKAMPELILNVPHVTMSKAQKDPCNLHSNSKCSMQDISPGFFTSFDGKEDYYSQLVLCSAEENEERRLARIAQRKKMERDKVHAIVHDENDLSLGLGYMGRCYQIENSQCNGPIYQDTHQVTHQHDKDEDTHQNIHKNFLQDGPQDNHQGVYQNFLKDINEDYTQESNQGTQQDTCQHWKIKTVKIVFPTRLQDCPQLHPQQQNTRPTSPTMQMLGRLIHQIFSQGKALDMHTSISETSDKRESKQAKQSRDSLFLYLLHGGNYPLSLCRLLSDMMDPRQEYPSSRPLSFQDVVDDLEQMASKPQVFLCRWNHLPPKPVFGQRYYGRREELEKLLAITRNINDTSNIFIDIPSNTQNVEAVFVSGITGSGKTHLLRKIGDNMSANGWLVTNTKFRRSQHSQSSMSFLFENLVARLIEMKNGFDEDYSQKVAETLLDVLGLEGVMSLSEFIPNLWAFIDDNTHDSKQDNHGANSIGNIGNVGKPSLATAQTSHHKLVFLLSKFLDAILSLPRPLMIWLDDLQWCDAAMLSLMSELILHAGHLGYKRFLFAGTYRSEEVSIRDPLSFQLMSLGATGLVNVSHVRLAGLPKEDVVDMISCELKLCRRFVVELADVVYKKTLGYAIFVVQLLNSLVRKGSLSYSLSKGRYCWQWEDLCYLKTCDDVASLIVSNLSSLDSDVLANLEILSCFGTQLDLSLLEFLQGFSSRVVASLPVLVECGILETAGPLVMFAHDLIQQQVYESMPLRRRRQLHLELGTFLGSRKDGKVSFLMEPLVSSMQQWRLQDDAPTTSIIVLAADQINSVDLAFVSDAQSISFAQWNLEAGRESADQSNFREARSYFTRGIDLLGPTCWKNYRLCLDLHEGMTSSLLALGEAERVPAIVGEAVSHVPTFEDTLVLQYLLMKSLETLGKYEESIAKGVQVLRRLDFDIPPKPCIASVKKAMLETGQMASRFTMDQIIQLQKRGAETPKRNIIKIMDALCVSCYRLASPHLSLVGCELLKYSLLNGICEESATAFAAFGYFKIFLEADIEQGKHWAHVAGNLLRHSCNPGAVVRARIILYAFVSIWFTPAKETAKKLLETHESMMIVGDVSNAMIALGHSLNHSLLGGQQLSLLLNFFTEERLQLLVKYNIEIAKFSLLDMMLLDQLIGNDINRFCVFGSAIPNEEALIADAESKKNFQVLEAIYLRRFFSSFWAGNFIDAERWSQTVLGFSSCRMPKMHLIYHTFFTGLVCFHVYRLRSGKQRLERGQKVMETLKSWMQSSDSIFRNKYLLVEAEYCASTHRVTKAKECYVASIQSARDHGNVHEQALANELLGNFLHSIGDRSGGTNYLNTAYNCYYQWGAMAKAKQLCRDHDLEQNLDCVLNHNLKHGLDHGLKRDLGHDV